MKSTGVVRRVDKLGRIVIPKEIRRNLKIREEDNLEIFIDSESIILKKYSLFSRFNTVIDGICDVIHGITGKHVVITDMEKVMVCNSQLDSIYKDKELAEKFVNLIDRRETLISNEKLSLDIVNVEDKEKYYFFNPIIINGEIIGSIVIFSYDNSITNDDKLIIKFVLKYLEKNIED